MKTKTPTPQLVHAYKGMLTNLTHYERLVLELMRHPDATPQQMVESGGGYRRVWASWYSARAALREKYPQRGLPWY